MSLSKEEKRNLKKEYKEALMNQVTNVLVISQSLSAEDLESKLLDEFRAINLNPAVSEIKGTNHQFLVSQRANPEHNVRIAVRRVNEDLIDLLSQREILMEADVASLYGFGAAVLSSQSHLSEENDLLLSASVRVFGRMFQGYFANAEAVMDDWLSCRVPEFPNRSPRPSRSGLQETTLVEIPIEWVRQRRQMISPTPLPPPYGTTFTGVPGCTAA